MAERKGTTGTAIRHLYKTEPPRKLWLKWEGSLLNLTRKLSADEKLEVMFCAERFALARINTRLRKKRLASREARHG